MSKLKDAILELGNVGCQGNLHDYQAWLRYYHRNKEVDFEITDESVSKTLDELISEGSFKTHPEFPDEYLLSNPTSLPDKVEYIVSGALDDSPIQLVRSRLEAFLRSHQVSNEIIIDLTIGTTEAMENAVKYSDHRKIEVSYHITDQVFHIQVINRMGDTSAEEDIEAGKYSSSVTLMRGMMVMVKLFDDMDIDISEETKSAIFKASKNLS